MNYGEYRFSVRQSNIRLIINMAKKHVPQRTCIVCRQKTDKRRLTRIVRTPENQVAVDKTGKQNGRGAYVCDQSACWQEISSKPGILNQALKTQVSSEDLSKIAISRPETAVAETTGGNRIEGATG